MSLPNKPNRQSVEDFAGEALENLWSELSADSTEQLTGATARGGPDNSALTVRGILGVFYQALELRQQDSWASMVGMRVMTDARTATIAFAGNVTKPRLHYGGIQPVPLNTYEITVTNQDYEASIHFSLHDRMWDKTGHLARKMSELSEVWARHDEELAVDVLENNDTAYDGVALFSASHSFGSSGTLSNLLTQSDLGSLNVSDTNRPTKAESAAILADLAAYFRRYKDDQGRAANQGARRFGLLCHPACSPGFIQALRDQLYVQGGSNELRNLRESWELFEDPTLASDTVIYAFRLDGIGARPLIISRAKEPTLQRIGPDSEHAIKNNEELLVSKACMTVVPGEWRHAIKATLA